MRKNIFFIAILSLTVIISCRKENVAVDKDPIVADLATYFASITPYNKGITKIIPVDATDTIGTPITITKTNSTSDVVYTLSFSSRTAQNGIQYTAPLTGIIKAGTYSQDIYIKGNPAKYQNDEQDTVFVKLQPQSGTVIQGRDSLVLIFRKYCPVDISLFNTSFSNSIVFGTSDKDTLAPYETYTIDSLGMIPVAKAKTAKGYIYDLYPGGSGGLAPDPLVVTFDWSDKTNFKVSFDDQYFYTNGAGAPRNVRESATHKSTFNSCDMTVDLYMDVYSPSGGTVVAADRHIKLRL